jgi:hypothetical protein
MWLCAHKRRTRRRRRLVEGPAGNGTGERSGGALDLVTAGSWPTLPSLTELTYTFVPIAMHTLQPVWREGNRRTRSFPRRGFEELVPCGGQAELFADKPSAPPDERVSK